MNAIIFSDLHGCQSALKKIKVLINDEKNNITVIIFAGDLVNMGEPVEYVSDFIGVVNRASKPLLWVPGNNDFGRSYEILNKAYPSLEGRVMEVAGRRFTGVGGPAFAKATAGKSPFLGYENEINPKQISAEKISGSVFVSHYPPPRVFTYVQERKGLSPISSLFSAKITDKLKSKSLAFSPLVHICGHIHHQQGIAYLGKTKIIKVGSAESGHYAIMNLETLEVDFLRL